MNPHNISTRRSALAGAGLAMFGASLSREGFAADAPPIAADVRLDVRAFGAIGDGVADDTKAFQAALDKAGAAGGALVDVPAGRFRIGGHLAIPANVTLHGIFRVWPTTAKSASVDHLTGSVLLAYAGRGSNDGAPFITLAGNNATIAGLIIAYPEWKQTDVPPAPYPPCVSSQDSENVGIRDCLLLNPYEAIRLIRSHRHIVRNITGYPSWRGIFVDECMDIGHIENIHFWPFGVRYDPHDPFCQWVNTNGVAFELARTDWHYVFNTFCFGYGVGYKFSESKHGSANGNFLGLGADSCQRAVLVEQAQEPGLLITNGEFVGRWSSTDSVCLEIGPNVRGKVSLVNCAFWGPIDRCVWMHSPSGQFTASACNFVDWEILGDDSPAIQLDAGKAIVQGCTFNQAKLHVRVGDKVTSAILTANQATGGFRIDNQAGKRTQSALNEEDAVEWTPAALSHYRLNIGEAGDGRYLQGWHGAEKSCRWSKASSWLLLPVIVGKAYTITVTARIPGHAVSSESGLYIENVRIVAMKEGQTLTAAMTPSVKDRIRIELRSHGWIPQDFDANSKDPRMLGVMGYSVEMKTTDASEKVFIANTGQWLEENEAK